MNEGIERETIGEAATPDVDGLQDAGVLELLRHESVVKQFCTLAGVRLNAPKYTRTKAIWPAITITAAAAAATRASKH